ncbi:MAG TPA: hypothetical protein VH188_03385 [Chthoniobacterales bacterium]|jgi:hypothetical protein|nr:hypothetical protein [Chthoniobacterales bacterium]
MTKTIVLLLAAGWIVNNAAAQETPTPTATSTPAPRSIRISFVPPPLDGTISLGVYDASGKLVRVLFREADINEFNIGTDSLSTTWDGKNDAGENVPAGKYTAHGFVVGDLKIEGVGFFFNDWITSADGPRFSHIRSLAMRDENLLLAVDLVPPGEGHVLFDVGDKSITVKDTDSETNNDTGAGVSGRDGTRWVIQAGEVKQLSANGEILRQLPIVPEQPAAKSIAASLKEDKIYLLEENEKGQRVRALTLVATKGTGNDQAISEWKVDFEKSIVAHKNFSIAGGKPVATPAGENIPDRVKMKLQANPLLNDDRVTVEMIIGLDADGSFIKAADGLPLCTISETQNLSRALLAPHGANGLDVFQDDGAVVEQFRITGVDEMMSFDCGGFELK